MTKIYNYFSKHRWLVFLFFICVTLLSAYLAVHCKFEENIAKLLPTAQNSETVDLAFNDLRVKDQIFIQVLADTDSKQGQTVDCQVLAEAMDSFMVRMSEYGEADGNIDELLYTLNPLEYTDLAMMLMANAPTYLDFKDEMLDSLLTEQHLTAQIAQYVELMQTDMGEMLYDLLAYDPAGITLYKAQPLLKNAGSGRFRHNHLFSADTLVCQGFIQPHLNMMNSRDASVLTRSIRRAKAEVEEMFPVKVLYHGIVVQSANNARRIKADLAQTIGVAIIILAVLLAVFFKQPSSLLLLFLPVLFGAVLALGCMYVLRGGMSIMALGIASVVLGVAISYSLHVLVHYKYTGSAERVVRDQSKPVFLGALTTAGAFAGLLFTESPLLSDFGLFSTLTMVGTTLACLFLLPYLFSKKNYKNETAFRFVEKVNRYELDHNKFVVALLTVFVVVSICFAGKAKFDDNLHNINYMAPEVQQSLDLWSKNNQAGQKQQYYASVSSDLETALQQLETIEQQCDTLIAEGLASGYFRTSAVLPSMNKQTERVGHWREYFSDDKIRTVTKNLEKACLANDIDVSYFQPFLDAIRTDVEAWYLTEENILPQAVQNILIEQTDGNYLVFIPVRMPEQNLMQVNDRLSKVEGCLVLDPFYYTKSLVEIVKDDFNKVLLVSSLFVFLVLLLTYKRLILTLIAFLPMGLSWYVVQGVMYLTGESFNLINIVLSSFVFGIGVDYSIFIMDGLLARVRQRDEHLLMYHKTAITLSATVLVICMASMLFAQHPAIRSIGLASLIGMITTILLSYTLQPFLFRKLMSIKWIREKEL
ncbi:MAG: MMPL family transporter [Paludibacteraceae bacterium]|nr:MMPL family transporter [Paludibacteraceae bacterium]